MIALAATKDNLSLVQLATGVAPRNATVPIIGQVMIEAGKDKIDVAANNLDFELRVSLSGKGKGDFTATAPAHVLAALLSGASGDIAVERKDDALFLAVGSARHRLRGLNPEDFPALQREEGVGEFEIEAAGLKFLIDSVAHAMSHETQRPYLNGIFLHGAGTRLKACATNGHVLALAELDCAPGHIAGIVPRELVPTLAKIAARGGTFRLALGASKLALAGGNVSLLSKLVDGTFPDYERVIPAKGAARRIEADAAALAAAIAQVSPFLSGKQTGIKFSAAAGTLALSVVNDDGIGDSRVEIAAEFTGEAMEFGLSGPYVGDALKALPDGVDRIAIDMADPGSPARIEPIGREDLLFVIMPLRV